MNDRSHEVDWSGLFHASGPAGDTPLHPAALLGDDAKAFVAGYSHLWSATLRRQGKAWPATAPTALLVAELLDNPLLGPDDPSLPDAMLAYLYEVGVAADLGDRAAEIRARVRDRAPELRAWTAEYVSTDADGRARMWRDGTGPGELVLDQAALACFDLVPVLLRRTLPHLASERARRRTCAAAAVGSLARHPAASGQRPGLLDQLTSMARAADSPHDLATIVIAIGHLDGDTRPWLADAHAGVRACAALATDLQTHVREAVASSASAGPGHRRRLGRTVPGRGRRTPPLQPHGQRTLCPRRYDADTAVTSARSSASAARTNAAMSSWSGSSSQRR
ncbi:hypothetical protein OH779_39005 [Actinacidiphila glaucinigra]|uniref:hypothetical protein n=1 Tax=Actinacidiphila glaucinigra TaxID=235986 RepID=UPI00386A162D